MASISMYIVYEPERTTTEQVRAACSSAPLLLVQRFRDYHPSITSASSVMVVPTMLRPPGHLGAGAGLSITVVLPFNQDVGPEMIKIARDLAIRIPGPPGSQPPIDWVHPHGGFLMLPEGDVIDTWARPLT